MRSVSVYPNLERRTHGRGLRTDRHTQIENNRIISNLPTDPVMWTERVRILKGAPFSFDQRPYLHPIYRDTAKEIYVVKGRQTEQTEWIDNMLMINGWKYPGTVHLYLSDRESHTSKFSNLRVRDWTLKPSKLLNLIAPWKKHTATKLPFENGSIAYFHSAWSSFEEARSVPADFLYLDELQSVAVSELAVLKEAAGHSKHGNIYGVGTGSWVDSDWYKLWHRGTQSEWNTTTNEWVARNPGAKIHSYHIPQTIVPWITEEDIEEKRRLYTPDRFQMEVMGWWARGVAKPLTEQMIRAILDTTHDFISAAELRALRKRNPRLGPVIAGIDWAAGGSSATVVYFGLYLDPEAPVCRAVNIIKIDDTTDVHEISRRVINALNEYDPDFGVQDAGGNPVGIQDVEARFGHRIAKCVFMTRPSDPWKLDDLRKTNTVKVDRSFAFQHQIDLIARHHVNARGRTVPREQIPYMNPLSIDWIVDHFLALETKVIRLQSGQEHLIYLKPDDRQYDGLLSQIYKSLGFALWYRQRNRGGVVRVGQFGID